MEGSLRGMLDPQNCLDIGTTLTEGQQGKHLQGKYRKTLAAEIPNRRIYCFISIVIVIFIVTLSVYLKVLRREETPVSVVCAPYFCPPTWVGFGNKCFYFSEDKGNWTFSRNFCDSLEAELVQIDTQEEMNFLKRYKGPYDHWIGLSRESPRHPWNRANNTRSDFLFEVRGSGEVAYLNNNGVNSGRVYSERRWICSKLMPAATKSLNS